MQQSDTKKAAAPRVLLVAPEDWFFVSHFLGLARAARAAGFEVALATRIDRHRATLESEGLTLFPLEGARGSLASAGALAEMRAIRAAVAAFRPDLVHLITVRIMLLGGLALMGNRVVRLIFAPTGLGYLFARKGLATSGIRAILTRVLRYWLATGRAGMIAENSDDPLDLGIPADHPALTLVGGAGLDPVEYPSQPLAAVPPLRVAVVARMLHSKGIVEAVSALRAVRETRPDLELHLYGDRDPANPTSLSSDEMKALTQETGVFWHGQVDDIPRLWRENHLALLLSHREGMPRSLAEAAASARPIIVSDVPGCREIVRDGENGILVPLGDQAATVSALLRLAGDPDLRQRMGEASRRHFESRFTLEAVTAAILARYASLLGTPGR